MTRKSTLLFAVTSLFVVLAAAALPVTVRAALGITGVSPSVIVNNATHTVTIQGTDFTTDTSVSVGSTPFTTSFHSANELAIDVPAGFAPGLYSVTVDDSGTSETYTLPNALTVSAPTPTSAPFSRPQVVIEWYRLNVESIRFGQEFKLQVRLDNAGGSTAYGIQVTFSSSDLLMLENGGVVAAGNMDTVAKTTVTQTMTALMPMPGVSRVAVDMNVSYLDEHGSTFGEKFALSLPVAGGGGGAAVATATPTGLRRSQLVIKSYQTDVEILQPGVQFTLELSVQNMGSVPAKGVTMILGGGTASGSDGGTPQSGGISGGSGEFTNFAPLGSSNVQSLGDVPSGGVLTASQKLIVNVSTNPGAYPMKITFSYADGQGNAVNDEQVITLLVYSLPNVDIGFYQPVGPLMAGQPNALPLQVVNLGRKTAVLGKMKVQSSGGMVENGEMLVGPLDPGGYFTMDSLVFPDSPGTLELDITIDYLDDFNQPRTITATLSLEVMDAPLEPTPDPSMPGGDGQGVIVTPGNENFWQKAWRFILGLLGLDSAAPGGGGGAPFETTPEYIPGPGRGVKG